MQYRRLGSAGVRLSTIALGGWINFEHKIPQREARRIIYRAYDGGVNFFDVADEYGQGKAEEWFGAMLAGFPRHTLVISSKVFFEMSDDINDRGLSRKHIFESIEKSLRRLRTDYLDIYFCHRYDEATPLLETCRAMNDLIRAGRLLYWGTSEWSADQLRKAVALCEKHHLHPPQTDQPEYSMLVRERVEQEIVPVAEQHGLGLVPWSPLAMGMLTGKYDDGIVEGARFSTEFWSQHNYYTEANIARVKRLKPIADDLGLTRAQLALAWLLRQPVVSSVITGATKVSQIESNLQAGDVTLDASTLAAIEEALR